MIILFTTSNYPTSWLIRKLTKEDCSHCALYLPAVNKIIHMNFLGFRVESPQDFTKHNRILHHVDIPKYKDLPLEYFKDKYGKSKYDIKALLFAGIRVLCKKAGISLPKVNLWQTTGMFMCTEFVTDVLTGGQEDSLVTPHQLYEKLNNKKGQ